LGCPARCAGRIDRKGRGVKRGRAHCGDRGVTEWIFTGTTADGKKVEVTGCDVFTFRNGKIAVEESYFENRTS